MALPLVEIIILNYRMREQVGDCLLSLRRLTYANYRIVVVDNDSGDGIREMLKTDYGRVINIASIAGKDGNPNAPAYSASKAAVIGLTKSLGKETAKTGIRVNGIAPAAIAAERAMR